MKIIIISINFHPEDSSTGLYTTQMAEYLKERGHNLSVITGFPYYPQWRIFDAYKDRPQYLEEEYRGIKIYRYKQFVPENPDFKGRVKQIISFTLGSLKNIKKIKDTDVVISVVPFTASVLLGYLIKKRTGAKLWVHVQDFEFDAAFEAGVASKSSIKKLLLSKVLYRIETALFNRADILSSISYSMLEKAKKKTKTELFYFPNWIDADFINPEKAKLHPYMKTDKFKILYSGNIGAKQDWQQYVRIVSYFEKSDDVEFILVGDGAKKDWVLSQLKNKKNVRYYPPVPYEELPDLLCSADIHVLFQKSDVIDTVMPSKLLGMMASAKPSVITGNPESEVSIVINKAQGKGFFKPEDFESVVEFIKMLKEDRETAQDIGRKARNYVKENFSKEKVLNRFERKLLSLSGG